MTRVIVYSAALVAFVAATAMTIASILTPYWVSYSVTAQTGSTFTQNIGLHKSCSSVSVSDQPCEPFPSAKDCRGDERTFCSMWRTTGFLMSFATVAELASLVSFVVIMGGGKYKRETGWKVLGTLMLVVGVVELLCLSIVAYLLDNDEKFLVPGWRLDSSWILCTVSGTLALLCAAGLAISKFVLPPEADYEFLDDPVDVDPSLA